MWLGNPFAFKPGQVTFWTTAIYLAVTIPLLYVHETVPAAPTNRSLYNAIDLQEAYQDLQNVTAAFHPFNSHNNDRVRDFYISRAKEILDRNNVDYITDRSGGVPWHDKDSLRQLNRVHEWPNTISIAPYRVVLFDDEVSNTTWISSKLSLRRPKDSEGNKGEDLEPAKVKSATYFEGNNFYIYIPGTNDPQGDWWRSSSYHFKGEGGVLVNCHIDSVSTAYGATDDAVGCISMLQLLSYFTSTGRRPKNGIVLLFNNAEEDGLFGAVAFGYSPLLPFLHTFVNLEGAGAGGRAILFRTTDLQAAKAYSKTPHPFGSIVADNAFSSGLIKSRTDYEIWDQSYGQRGLDIAFYAPRARYHTDQDDTPHTSINSIWHMLSATLAATKELSENTGRHFHGPPSDKSSKRLVNLPENGKQTDGVWFDLLGAAWAVFALRGLFAWSLCLLVAAPLVLFLISYLLGRNDKYYFFARDITMHHDINDDPVVLGGWKGFFRFPFALVFASGLTIGSVLLLAKFNPLIAYGNSYSVFAMSLSIFYFSFWLIMRGSSFVRPSALHRGFVLMWLFILGWGAQVYGAVIEDRSHYGFLYPIAFFQSTVFLAFLISLLEQFSLLGKHHFALQLHDAHQSRDVAAHSRDPEPSAEEEEPADTDETDNAEQSPTEQTPLRAGETGYGSNNQTSFANTYRRTAAENSPAPPSMRTYKPFDHEQSWSGRLTSWTWIIQFLLLAPIPCFLIGNLGLFGMSALNMTGTDGGTLALPVLALGAVSIAFLLPITPFIHRVTHHIPMFLLCIFAGTLVYNLLIFPFSASYRFKFYFQQRVNLDDDSNRVIITGLPRFTRQVIEALPIASGLEVNCTASTRLGLKDCSFDGSAQPPKIGQDKDFNDLISLKSVETDSNDIVVLIDAKDTRVCNLAVSPPIKDFKVQDAAPTDPRFTPKDIDKLTGGIEDIALWRRDRSQPWKITLKPAKSSGKGTLGEPGEEDDDDFLGDGELKARSTEEFWTADSPLKIKLTCLWSDANAPGTIPVLDDLHRYMPAWATVTKKDVGLVEVEKTFTVNVDEE